MRQLDIAGPVERNVVQDDATGADQFTSATFLKEAGIVIAVCLGLGLLMQLLLG